MIVTKKKSYVRTVCASLAPYISRVTFGRISVSTFYLRGKKGIKAFPCLLCTARKKK